MKHTIFTLIGTLLLSVTSHALEVHCTQDFSYGEKNTTGVHYVVDIADVEDLTPKSKHHSYDKVHLAKVTVGLEHEYGGSAGTLKDFLAISTSEDVYYTIDSLQQNGFSFYLYLDEYDQAGMTIVHDNGQSEVVNLTCESL